MSHCLHNLRRSTYRPAFTLVEMLVVVAIMVLAMTLAIPAIRSLTGSRSLDAAENKVSSYVAMTRAEAIGLQRIEGVLFFLDTTTDRVGCIAVKQADAQSTDDTRVIYLDLVDDRDPVMLPSGVRLWAIKDSILSTDTTYVEPLPNSRFLGFNWYDTPINNSSMMSSLSAIPGGVILFDGHSGQLTCKHYGFRFASAGSNTVPPSQLGRLLFANLPALESLKLKDWPAASATKVPALISQVGFVLCDRETFTSQPFIVAGSTDQNDITGGATEQAIDAWFDTNTTPVFVNRYDGTMMRAE